MKKYIVILLVCILLFTSCDEIVAETETSAETETTECETNHFGLTEKEIEAIEEIIGKPYTLDDISEVVRLGYDKMYVKGEWVENTQLIEYKVVLKNGETRLIAINKIMLED